MKTYFFENVNELAPTQIKRRLDESLMTAFAKRFGANNSRELYDPPEIEVRYFIAKAGLIVANISTYHGYKFLHPFNPRADNSKNDIMVAEGLIGQVNLVLLEEGLKKFESLLYVKD